MCGRFALYANESEIISHFRLVSGFSMRPRYNIAPTQIVPVITSLSQPIEFFRWGFIPSWQLPTEHALPAGYINARLESCAQKPTFKQAFLTKRCLIPISGYYEWRTMARGKQPYYVYHRQEEILALAGVWSTWQDLRGQPHATCAILTQEAPACLKMLHERAPVIIHPDYYSEWLHAKVLNESNISKFLFPLTDQTVGCHAVTPRMGRPEFEGIECILSL